MKSKVKSQTSHDATLPFLLFRLSHLFSKIDLQVLLHLYCQIFRVVNVLDMWQCCVEIL